jgi:hypothetical protein
MGMNKELVLKLMSEAIDEGASISVHITQFKGVRWPFDKRTKQDAEEFITRCQEAIGGEIESIPNSELPELSHFINTHEGIRFTYSFFNEEGMEEDVDLSGMKSGDVW